MSEPLELKEQTPYAIDRLDTLKAAIMHSIQEMVIHRAKVEKYRKSDLPTARSAYETLEYFRKQLAEQLMESQLILLETEAYKLASMAGQLHQGVSGYTIPNSESYERCGDAAKIIWIGAFLKLFGSNLSYWYTIISFCCPKHLWPCDFLQMY